MLQEVKRRLDAYDPDGARTLWMKNSEIGHYEMARQGSEITTEALPEGEARLQIRTQFPTANFTLSLETAAKRVQANGHDLRPVTSRRDFRSGTYLVEAGRTTFAAFDLPVGVTTLQVAQV